MANTRLYISGGYTATGPTGHTALCTTNPNGFDPATNVPININHNSAAEIRAIVDRDVTFTGGPKVLAVGDNELVYWTDDSGATWTQSLGIAGTGRDFKTGNKDYGSTTMWVGADLGIMYISGNDGITFIPLLAGSLPTPTGTANVAMEITAIEYSSAGLFVLTWDSVLNETWLFHATVGTHTSTPTFNTLNGGIALSGKCSAVTFAGLNNIFIYQDTGVLATSGIRLSPSLGAAFNAVQASAQMNDPSTDCGHGGIYFEGAVSAKFFYGGGQEIKRINSYAPVVAVTERAYNVADPRVTGMAFNSVSAGWVAMDNGEVYRSIDGGATSADLIYTHPSPITDLLGTKQCTWLARNCDTAAIITIGNVPCSLSIGTVIKVTEGGDCYELLGESDDVSSVTVFEYSEEADCDSCLNPPNWRLDECGAIAFKIIDGSLQDLSAYEGFAILADSVCYAVTSTLDAPTDPPLIAIDSSHAECESCMASNNYLLENCTIGGLTVVVHGGGYVVGEVVSIDNSPVLANCWTVLALTAAPNTVVGDVTNTFPDCTFIC